MPRLVAFWFDDVYVYSILDKKTITALDMEAERAYSCGNVGDFNPSTDAHRLGD
jgi:hypothetical protein